MGTDLYDFVNYKTAKKLVWYHITIYIGRAQATEKFLSFCLCLNWDEFANERLSVAAENKEIY